jgi:predicted metalloprotease
VPLVKAPPALADRVEAAVRAPNLRQATAAAVAAGLLLSGCTVSVTSPRRSNSPAPNATSRVINDGGTPFDQLIKNAVADVQSFWRATYPTVSGGQPYQPLSGGIYSVNGDELTPATRRNACLAQQPNSVQNNAFYCQLDDSVVYDRNPEHLIAQLGQQYGQFIVVAVIAHEWGHAIQQRLGIFDGPRQPPTIATETQADCAAGAFIGAAQKGQAPHFPITQPQVERTLLGYLEVRDPPPVSASEISHGNGFDRLTAMAEGIQDGAAHCFNQQFLQRSFTERPFTSDADYLQHGNLPFEQVVQEQPTSPGQTTLQEALNTFWAEAASSIGKDWRAVRAVPASRPPCTGSDRTKLAYCPSQNELFYDTGFARQAYNSLPSLQINPRTGRVRLVDDAPADYALGTLFGYGWAMAVRAQLFGQPIDDKAALIAASCYSGAFTASINSDDPTSNFQLSPPDMDEATEAVIKLVPMDQAFGARGTTALDRIEAFTRGYFQGLPGC